MTARQRAQSGEPDPIQATIVTCACGWSAIGPEELVVESMQVHGRRIHGLELTRDAVVARGVRPVGEAPSSGSGVAFA